MGYLQIQCLRCGQRFDLTQEKIEDNTSLICPACGVTADKKHWNRIRAGFYLCQRLCSTEESVELRLFQAEYVQ